MRILLLAIMLLSSSSLLAQTPKVNDERLKIELFAEAPDIVTPIGIDVDERGRVYVIESHTHFPPEGYKLEKTDRIRVLEDTNGDRKADKITDFHTGETHTMGIALYRDGSLYVATRREVFRLRDTNNDGKADERTSLVKLETKGNYPHNGLCGFAFDFKGDVYFGFGENLGESYKLIGSDGTTLTGGGEGGNIYTCDPEGKKLRRVATGFWNPFHLCFDTFGRLFAIDNDPDGRPPCRLLHIVEGGDYGYRFRYGRGGQHPFTSWNGEIPGTLPMVAGTGEAPSGVLSYESDNLPDDYLGTLLVTSWGDHRIEKYRLKPNGASFTSKMEPVITGGENFRPVGIALAPDGSLFISDWVDKSYNVHGKGRVWRISAKEEKKAERPDPVKEPEKAMLSKHRPTRERAAEQLQKNSAGVERLRALAVERANDARTRILALNAAHAKGALDAKTIRAFIVENHPTLSVAAAHLADPIRHPYEVFKELGMASIQPDDRITGLTRDSFPLIDALIRRSQPTGGDLTDLMIGMLRDPFILQGTAGHISRAFRTKGLAELDGSNSGGMKVSQEDAAILDDRLFGIGILLAQRMAKPDGFDEQLRKYVVSQNTELRFLAIQWIAEEKLTQYRKDLTDSLARPDNTPRLLIATLTALDMLDGSKPGAVDQLGARWYLERLVFGDKTPAATKAMAMRMLPANNPALTIDAFKKLLAVEDEKFRVEVVRTLRDSPHKEKAELLRGIAKDEKQPKQVRAEAVIALDKVEDVALLNALVEKDEEVVGEAAARVVASQVFLAPRPKDTDTKAWLAMLGEAATTPTNVSNGERLFFNINAANCSRCHTAQGRGGSAGPDLSTIGKSLTRERLLESILQPSKEIAPRFAAQLVELSDGEKHTLMYVGPAPDGTQIWADTNGKERRIAPGEIESKRPLETSIMPTGLHQNLTARELRDLIAFLESLK